MYIETTTFYNPSVLNIIGWENKHTYLRSGILHGGEEGGGGGGREWQENSPVYSFEGLGLYISLLGWL